MEYSYTSDEYKMELEQSDISDQLCDVCCLLDISPARFVVTLDDDKVNWRRELSLGSLYDIQKKRHCPLCRLVCRGPFQGKFYSDAAKIQCQIYWVRDAVVINSRGQRQCCTRALILRAVDRTFSSPEPRSPALFAEKNRLVPMVAGKGFGRQVKAPQVDFKLLKMWLRSCQKWHVGVCDDLIFGSVDDTGLPYFKVIDVWKQCVVNASIECRYFALSYVWGSAKSFLTTKADILHLERPGSLAERAEKLCETVKDAMMLVSKLGARYLWVDSLCIVQDDDVDTKQAMISNMNSVYGNAFLTLIAATGRDANAGLPGVRRGSRARYQAIETIRPGMALAYVHHLRDSENQSIHNTRGWTYQEKFFSRRRLYFVDGQAIFRCRKACWREDIQAECSELQNQDVTRGHQVFGIRERWVHPLQEYTMQRYSYIKKDLTFENDILNAFTGILKVLAVLMDASMIYGLPSSVFDWSILWESTPRLRRRAEFPSWSWAGWIGGVQWLRTLSPAGELSFLNPNGIRKWLTEHTWILWRHCRRDGSGLSLVWKPKKVADTTVPAQRPPGYQQSADSDCYGRPIRTPARFSYRSNTASGLLECQSLPCESDQQTLDNCSVLNIPGLILRFWTISAKYHLSHISSDRRYPNWCYFFIRGTYEVYAGQIWLNRYVDTVIQGSPEYEFLVLSDTTVIPSDNMSDTFHDFQGCENVSIPHEEADQCNHLDAAGPCLPHAVVDTGPLGDDAASVWFLYNVMLIEWHNGIASRVGLGKIYRDALRYALPPGPQWKEISLG